MKKKIIIFDFDGTLWDTVPLLKLHIQNIINANIGVDYIQELYTHNIDLILKFKEHNHELKDAEEIEKFNSLNRIKRSASKPFLGIDNLLIDLKSINIVLSIATLASGKASKIILESNSFQNYFKYIYGKEDSLSKAENVLKILEKENLQMEEAVFVTDTLGDVREMDVLGVPTIAVTYGMHDRSFFEREKNQNLIAIVDSVAELQNKLKELI